MRGGKMAGKICFLGLLLAIILISQNLRLLVPLPGIASMLITGSLCNLCLLLAGYLASFSGAVILCFLTPVVAFLTGNLMAPLQIPLVGVTSFLYVAGFHFWSRKSEKMAVIIASILRLMGLYGSVYLILALFEVPPALQRLLNMSLGIPQMLTGLLGGYFYLVLKDKVIAATKNTRQQ